MSKQMPKCLAAAVLALLPIASQALPIDWHGSFGVDSTIISDYRRLKSKTDNSTGNDGSQEVTLGTTGKKSSASWQSYVLRLAPTLVINDAATFFGELTTGYANGGYLGENSQPNQTIPNGNIYYHNQTSGSSVNIKKAYVELYSDTATYQIGRHSAEWALGAIYNDGNDVWDRHITSRDGITMKLKIGNFHVAPFWAKDSQTGYTDSTSAKQYGASLLYDNQEKDIAFGILYAKKSNSTDNTTFGTNGESNISITDLYLKKVWGKFDFGVELPLLSGDLKTATSTTISAKALLLQSNYKWTDSWTVGFDFGQVSGHDGSNSKFSALYLNPNYQIANLLFRYNLMALSGTTTAASVYDSYITNARYFKLRSRYNSEKWTFDQALIFAQAMEVAKAGTPAYNHTKNKNFQAVADQDKNLGTEIDLNANYHWNKEISVGAGLGYLITGDYFGFNNTATPNATQSSLLLQINTSVTF